MYTPSLNTISSRRAGMVTLFTLPRRSENCSSMNLTLSTVTLLISSFLHSSSHSYVTFIDHGSSSEIIFSKHIYMMYGRRGALLPIERISGSAGDVEEMLKVGFAGPEGPRT